MSRNKNVQNNNVQKPKCLNTKMSRNQNIQSKYIQKKNVLEQKCLEKCKIYLHYDDYKTLPNLTLPNQNYGSHVPKPSSQWVGEVLDFSFQDMINNCGEIFGQITLGLNGLSQVSQVGLTQGYFGVLVPLEHQNNPMSTQPNQPNLTHSNLR